MVKKNLSLSTLSMLTDYQLAVSARNVQGCSALPSVVLTENWSKDDEIKNLTNKSRNNGIKRLVPVIPRSARCLFIGTCHLVCLDAV